jgi:hypothetical protein
MVDVRHANIEFHQGFSAVPARTRRGKGSVFSSSVDRDVPNLALDVPPKRLWTHAVSLGAVNFPLEE